MTDPTTPDPTETEKAEAAAPEEAVTETEAAEAGPTEADRIAELEAEVATYKDQLLRALAEQENIRKRMQRELEDGKRYGVTNFARELVPTADNLRRAIESVPNPDAADEATKNLLNGIAATERALLAAFEKANIRRIDPMHEPFDHNWHQALFEVEHSGHPAGTVVQVLQPGFVIHDRILRAAMVGVAKGEVEALPGGGAKAEGKKPESYQRVDTKAR